jgi:hypothetical protein
MIAPASTGTTREQPAQMEVGPHRRRARFCRRSTVALSVVLLVFATVVVLVALMPSTVERWITRADDVDPADPVGLVVFFFALWATVSPVIPGYNLVLLAIGYVYGWKGAPLAILGSWSGALVWFAGTRPVARHYGVTYAHLAHAKIIRRYERLLLAVEDAVNRKGKQVCCLTFLARVDGSKLFGSPSVFASISELTPSARWSFFCR